MMRLFELIVALIIVAILAVVVAVALPSSGHVERSLLVSKNIRDVYDMLDGFHKFPEYAVLRAYDPQMQYEFSGAEKTWAGPGASISWTSNVAKVGNGKLTVVSDKPGFDKVNETGSAHVVWSLKNGWRGSNKMFTIDLKRTGRSQKLVKVTWSYDVDYGWNLLDRYSDLYIHGEPDSLIQYSLNNLQNLLASVPSIDYGDLIPQIVDTPQQPVLFVSTQAKRNLNDVDTATDAAMLQIKAAMKKLGVKQAGPRTTFTTNYGDTSYAFDVAVPINASTLKIDGQSYDLTVPKKRSLAEMAAEASSTAAAGSVAGAGSSALAHAGSSALAHAGSSAPANAASVASAPKPGSRNKSGELLVDGSVRGMLAFGGKALTGEWNGSPAGVPTTRVRLEAYATTHGYRFDEVVHHPYDVQKVAYQSKRANGEEVAYDEQTFEVYLPLSFAPTQTPEQAAGIKPPAPYFLQPSASGTAPAPASSTVAPSVSSSSG